ncbi:DUF2092 domain-containing protein [Sphingomonas sp. R-74633]|uniref:DUF2092 domain-containing protein n=1 Tax=Sphingomonas sp. R-74633 TaxID=2751188 RepID=UPI0015D1D222|nr:DUF2092 domain-containing protein [Sphingomonas sp. R-74633]NYT39815.1 DUF2092 domain-containing protein [Sphingomonas sp. R-74633]
MRIRYRQIAALCGVAALAVASPSLAQSKKAAAKPAKPAAAAVDTQILGALQRMANAMKSMDSFELRADMTSEDVLDSGQKLQSSNTMTALIRRPNRLQITMDSERRNRRFFYDGKQLTIYGPATGYYAQVAAPPTIRAMLNDVADRYGVDTPLADLMMWGETAVKTDQIKSSMYAGADRIGTEVCDQYAFRQDGTDWQLWIRRADPALPCKVVITNTDDPAQPQTTAVFTWMPRSFTDADFAFTPPADARRIEIGKTQTAANGGGQ